MATDTLRIAVLTASVTIAAVAPAPAEATSADIVRRPSLQLVGLSTEQVDAVSHAVDLFAAGRLDLPPLVIRVHSDDSACGGHDGLHRAHDGWSEIELCAAGGSTWESRVVLHELAHAWAADRLTAARKDAFQQVRGLEVWRDYTAAAWEDNGTEQAAEIIAWGLNDRPAATVRISDTSCADLRAGYLTLTGIEPPFGLTDICAGAPAPAKS